ncbi:MAG: threonine/serine dehydratase [Inquilinus sp.]|nr:threonine/serine dehydratase [Inquilinus sp.]
MIEAHTIDRPTIDQIDAARARLGDLIVETPVTRWRGREIESALPPCTEIVAKLENFQITGTFKPRGALTVMLDLPPAALERGVTALSAGNHAIATAYAAKVLGAHAKVVMPRSASPARIAIARAYGAEVVLEPDIHAAVGRVKAIEAEEGRSFVHPFEGPLTALGNATLGAELCRQAPGLEAVVVAIGGGGLCAGVATAVKLLNPDCEVFGVEPEGADTMHRSFAAGSPQTIDKVRTIADSLGAPYAAPYSFALCRAHVDALVTVDDDALRRAMALMARELKLMLEPAGAAATAALLGPLRERLAGKRIGIVVCGSNIDVAGFARLVDGLA